MMLNAEPITMVQGPDDSAGTRPLSQTPAQFCAHVAKMFNVQEHEVALLRVDGGFLRFAHPLFLVNSGRIPLTHVSCVAARTVNQRKPELFNNFAAVRHTSIFEAVPAGGQKMEPIQRLMSVPVWHRDMVVAVIQVSRKGNERQREFLPEDLQTLVGLVDSTNILFDKL